MIFTASFSILFTAIFTMRTRLILAFDAQSGGVC
jgi:hypothetical protein